MVEPESPDSIPTPFLPTLASGEESSNLRPKTHSFRKEIPQTRSFTFRKAAQRSLLFQPAGRKLRSRSWPRVILWEKRH